MTVSILGPKPVPAEPFKRGDVVVLKSGGAAMTVRGVRDGVAALSWHSDHSEAQDADYPVESLVVYVEKPKRVRAALRTRKVLKPSKPKAKKVIDPYDWLV